MRAVIQRTLNQAKVEVDSIITGQISHGLVVFLGIGQQDTEEDINWLANKIVNLRIFNDAAGKMNLSLKQIEGQILLISQFTLFADTKKGNRPSYIRSADPDHANGLYLKFAETLKTQHEVNTQTGVFGAHMNVDFINDGPVTIIIDTKVKQF